MFQIREYEDKYRIYELIDESTGSWVKVAPERGGIIIGFGVNGKELLYLDKDTFYDEAANIRGGIPILFPICGALSGGTYQWNGQFYEMKGHGFARNLSWEVISTEAAAGEASITMRLQSTEDTKKVYPFDFEVIYRYTLKGNQLDIHQEYANRSAQEMPFYAGLHPYFLTAEKELPYETDATQYYDYNDGQVKSYEGRIDLNKFVESAMFLEAKTPAISFPLPEAGKQIVMEYGQVFRYIVLWSVAGKDFVCVEPWMGRKDEMNRKEELQLVAPGQTLRTHVSIRAI
ncbi:aldose epimerase family protein [Brevibacillus migulae]|uniref:aldose epimerase family protein n=1 Tax=Brevibacillus migulae TaxID=1644114 RepID=UPI00106DFC8B|nr:aldose epimerase [Brevibacillus migulae]